MKQTHLQCADFDCGEAFEVKSPADVAGAIQKLKSEGWTIHPGYLRCPRHPVTAAETKRSALRLIA